MPDDGYRDFRNHLRAKLGVEEMRSWRTALTARLRRLIDEVADDAIVDALRPVLASLSDLFEASRACTDACIERSVLIEQQIEHLDFRGRLHDKHHETYGRLQAHYHSAVQHGKRLANSLARLMFELLPHEQRQDLRQGSFGKMYGSLSKMSGHLPEPLDSARRMLLAHGIFLESVLHEYRDDVIEHVDPRSEVNVDAIVTSDDRVDLGKSAPEERPDELANRVLDPNWPGFVYTDFWHSDTKPEEVDIRDPKGDRVGYQYHVHMHLNLELNLEPGDPVLTDTPIMFRTDGGSGHFRNFGPHSHTFSSRGIPKFLAPDPEVVYGMPSITELMARYASLASDTLDFVPPPSPE